MKRTAIIWVAAAAVAVQPVVIGAADATTRHPTVSSKATHVSVTVGQTLTLSGAVRPNQRGHRVQLQLLSHGSWKVKATTPLSRSSQYRFTLRPARAGKFTYRVYDPPAGGLGSNSSQNLVITAHARSS